MDIVSEHQDYTLREMADALVERGFERLSLKTIRGLLRNLSFTCKRICRVPRARNSEREVEERKVWGRTFNLLRIEGARFVFLDESGFDVNMSRGRGYARVSETPECYVPSKGPNISVMAAMSPELGVIHETHRGGVTAALFAQFLDRLFPILHRVYKEAPVALVMDNAVVHKTSRKEGVDVPEKIGEAGFFHLYTIPYSPQLNAIESLFAQVLPKDARTSRASSERPSERWKRGM